MAWVAALLPMPKGADRAFVLNDGRGRQGGASYHAAYITALISSLHLVNCAVNSEAALTCPT